MQTSDKKWNEQMENFNLKLKRLKNDVLDYKKISQTHLCKNRKVFIPPIKHDIKREFWINTTNNSNINNNNINNNNINNNNINNNNINNSNIKNTNININTNMEGAGGIYKIQKRRLGRCLLKETEPNASLKYIKSGTSQNGNNGSNHRQENRNVNFHFPLSKDNSKKTVKTNEQSNGDLNQKSGTNYTMRNKRKTEQSDKINDKSSNIVTEKPKEKETTPSNNSKDYTVLNKKTKKTKLLYLEGEDGKIVVRQMYRDKDVGFHNITKMDDECLSKVKRENQDDDDIKTSKHLAQWSSELVYKYINETIEKSKLHFLPLTVKIREKEILQRLRN